MSAFKIRVDGVEYNLNIDKPGTYACGSSQLVVVEMMGSLHIQTGPTSYRGMGLYGDLGDWYTCVECGRLEQTERYHHSLATELEERKLCFYCNFWEERLKVKDQLVIAGHSAYVVGNEDMAGPKAWRGFGGQRFRIQMHDGRQIETTNLWHNGEIPEHYRDRLPDNAEFVTEFTPQQLTFPFELASWLGREATE